ncbi:MAG TPA: DUF3450 domain-containing protein [Desulfarculaceae bacterium]|nr:DUF3450 domain-containing protein [Desulfarculaceae bacterium]
MLSLAWLLFQISPSMAAEPVREQLEKEVAKTVALDRQTSELQQKWLQEKQLLADETHNLKLEAKLLEARILRLHGYRQQRQREIQKLKNGLKDMAEIGIRLEPYLDELVDRTSALQASDLPFARVERKRRLADLADTLNSYDADLPDKLRRVMETLKIEAGFGRGFEVSEEVLPIAGGETTVRVLRLGRIGLYYLTLDGAGAGWFNREHEVWEELPGVYSESVKEALRMALKQRAFDLVRLPVAGGRP